MGHKIPAYMRQNYMDDNMKVPLGVYPGMSAVNKFGQNSAMASGATEDIWDGSALYSFPATALMVKMSQTADQEALRGEVIEVDGLDADWVHVIQDVTLDGTLTTTPVVLATPLIRVNRMKVKSAVVTDSPVRLHNSAENQDYAIIGIGNNQTLMAIYTVPADHTACMTNIWAVVNPGGGNPTSLDIKLWNRDNENGYAAQLKLVFGIDLDFSSHIQHQFAPYRHFMAKSDIFLSGTTVAATASVAAGFDLIITHNHSQHG